jgi:DNA polymerase I
VVTLIFHISWLDSKNIFKKRYKFSDQEPITNFNLENISQLFLGKGKIKHKEKIKWLWENAIDRLEEYNKVDVILLNELYEKLGIMDLIIGVCKESRTPYRNYYVSEVVDNYILNEAKNKGFILPSNMWKLENKEGSSEKLKYEGATVFDIIPGLYNDINVYDFSSMYPNMMITFNIGIDTFVENPTEEQKKQLIQTPNNCFFRKDIKSINAIIAEKLLQERQKAKDEMKKYDKDTISYKTALNKSEVIKVLSNSQYGAVGSCYTRYYSIQCSEAITLSAQYILKFTNKILTVNGKSIIAGDTDSVFVKGF